MYGWLYPPPTADAIGKTNYAGVCGARGTGIDDLGNSTIWAQWEGIFNARSATALHKITDGTSNTLMFGEALGDLNSLAGASGGRYYGWSWMGFGIMYTWRGLGGPDVASWGQFASMHSAVVHFCFADGSVRGLGRADTLYNPWPASTSCTTLPASAAVPPPAATQPGWWVLQNLAGMRDGTSPDTSGIVY
jgi:hypothetical protein